MKKLLTFIAISIFFLMIAIGAAYNSQLFHPQDHYPNAERDAKLAAGYKLYPGVGWVHPDDLGNQQPIYIDNPNNPDEQILDIDAMIKKNASTSDLKKLLIQNNIDYLSDKLVVTIGPTIRGDPGCGVVVDTDSITHWFEIDSISEPKKITLFSENPNQCEVNTSSCFCNAQRELSTLTLDELSYFTLQEEEKYAEILIDYLGKENINRTPKFQIGKFNLNYTDSFAIGYCGELWGINTYDFFEGAFVKNVVKDYSIDKEISSLCAISDDAKWWERK